MRHSYLAAAAAIVFSAGAACSAVNAAPPPDLASVAETVDALARMDRAYGARFSPDGTRIAYLSSESGSPQIWVTTLATGKSVQITDLGDPIGNVHWSPTGSRLAYSVAPGGGLNTQIYVIEEDAGSDGAWGDARLLTLGGNDNNGLAGWSDDGSALLIDSNRDNAGARDAGLIDVATGDWRPLVSNKGLNWITDERGDVVLAARLLGRGDSNLYAIDVNSGAEALLTPHDGKAESWAGAIAADGETAYLLSNVGRDRHAFGSVPLSGPGEGGITYFAVRDDAVAENMLLSDDGTTMALLWNAGGRSELVLRDAATGTSRTVEGLEVDTIGLNDFSADASTLLISASAANRPTDIYAVTVADASVRRLTQSAHDGVDLAALVRPELITYQAHDGLELSGWLYRPAGLEGPMPLVFSYHGGPEGQARPTSYAAIQALAASGIAVFAPNVRGSSGFGKAFMAMDDRGKRVDGVRDIESTTNALVEIGIADPERLGIMGGSYGGYMVMAGVTEFPDMFAAGVNLFGIVNFESFFRETEPWMAAISTTEYGDPATEADMLRALSPIHKLDRITTPLLVQHGANDTNVPVVEAEQIVASLQARGVDVKYTLFPDEGHGWRKEENRVRSTTEIVSFFAEHL
ncbi:S9 family peptidase [Pacificimonas sp. WHA3]|uniref:S9 family peptidase n=1 Tax=Pacificimonas pallii TaxID=2827236 RepID=A0ABS6SEG1_9SPHN|nr:S9 family peptidase [Pacificimonas pallii]MBV7256473.1 S9 family peptidase [Pacificimonas pallii]